MNTKIWVFLVLLTCITFFLGYFDLLSPFVILILLGSSFIKGVLISEHFMELRTVRLRYRIIPIIWLSFVLLLIAYAYYNPLSN